MDRQGTILQWCREHLRALRKSERAGVEHPECAAVRYARVINLPARTREKVSREVIDPEHAVIRQLAKLGYRIAGHCYDHNGKLNYTYAEKHTAGRGVVPTDDPEVAASFFIYRALARPRAVCGVESG